MEHKFQFDKARWRGHGAILLALLMLLGGIAQAAHWHADGLDHSRANGTESNCTLCLAMHAPAQEVQVCQLPVLVQCAMLQVVLGRQMLAQQTISTPCIRPPPTA
jgi:predicted transporter